MLASAYQSASLGEDPGTVSFKTPGGHTVVTPYSEQAIQHQMNRLGGKKRTTGPWANRFKARRKRKTQRLSAPAT
jgi:hypothetical protein